MQLVTRSRVNDDRFKYHSILVDAGNEDLATNPAKPAVVVPIDSDGVWYVVKPDQSIIFVNENGKMLLL